MELKTKSGGNGDGYLYKNDLYYDPEKLADEEIGGGNICFKDIFTSIENLGEFESSLTSLKEAIDTLLNITKETESKIACKLELSIKEVYAERKNKMNTNIIENNQNITDQATIKTLSLDDLNNEENGESSIPISLIVKYCVKTKISPTTADYNKHCNIEVKRCPGLCNSNRQNGLESCDNINKYNKSCSSNYQKQIYIESSVASCNWKNSAENNENMKCGSPSLYGSQESRICNYCSCLCNNKNNLGNRSEHCNGNLNMLPEMPSMCYIEPYYPYKFETTENYCSGKCSLNSPSENVETEDCESSIAFSALDSPNRSFNNSYTSDIQYCNCSCPMRSFQTLKDTEFRETCDDIPCKDVTQPDLMDNQNSEKKEDFKIENQNLKMVSNFSHGSVDNNSINELPQPQQKDLQLCVQCKCKTCPIYTKEKKIICPANCGCCQCPYVSQMSKKSNSTPKKQTLLIDCKCRNNNTERCECPEEVAFCQCQETAKTFIIAENHKTNRAQWLEKHL